MHVCVKCVRLQMPTDFQFSAKPYNYNHVNWMGTQDILSMKSSFSYSLWKTMQNSYET